MAVYRVRLEDPDSDEFRLVAVAADSEEEAEAICEAQGARHIGCLVGDGELTVLETQEAEGSLSGRGKARLYSHRELKPDRIGSVEGGD